MTNAAYVFGLILGLLLGLALGAARSDLDLADIEADAVRSCLHCARAAVEITCGGDL